MAGQNKEPTELWKRLRRLDRENGDSARYKGKVVLLVIGSLRAEKIDLVRKRYDAFHSRGLEVIQVTSIIASSSAPPEQKSKAAMLRFVAQERWPWPVLWDTSKDLAEEWGQNIGTAQILIGRDGRIVAGGDHSDFEGLIARELAREVPKM